MVLERDSVAGVSVADNTNLGDDVADLEIIAGNGEDDGYSWLLELLGVT